MNTNQNKTLLLCLMALFLAFSTSCSDDEPDRDKFSGSFSVVETCGGVNDTYDITILESGAGENAIVINNLYDWGESVSATVSGNNVTIPSQILDGITFSGSGSLSGNILTINFIVSGFDNCSAICTRKSDDDLNRERFLGSFSVVETCSFGNDTYEITLESGISENAVIINNLYNFGESASATVSGSDVTIPSQLLNGITFSGSGSISGNTLTINFSISDGTNSDNCNAICTRK